MDFNVFTGIIPQLPTTLLDLALKNNDLQGIIPTLPSLLRTIDVSQNQLIGSVPALPDKLVSFYAYENQLNGSITSLPESLLVLDVHMNQLTGVIPPLSSTLERLYVYNNLLIGPIPDFPLTSERSTGLEIIAYTNRINGTVPLTLPSHLKVINFGDNKLTGSLSLTLPEGLRIFHFDKNLLNGTLPTTLPSSMTSFHVYSNFFVGNLPSLIYATKLYSLRAEDNQLNGTVPYLPPSLLQLHLSNNEFIGDISIVEPQIVLLNNNKFKLVVIQSTSDLIWCDLSHNNFTLTGDLYEGKCVFDHLQSTTVYQVTSHITYYYPSSINNTSIYKASASIYYSQSMAITTMDPIPLSTVESTYEPFTTIESVPIASETLIPNNNTLTPTNITIIVIFSFSGLVFLIILVSSIVRLSKHKIKQRRRRESYSAETATVQPTTF